MEDLYEKPKEIEEPKFSDRISQETGSTRWRFPDTKRKALDFQDIGARISISQSLYGNILEFFMSIGADNELPNEKKKRISYINEFHDKMAVSNPLWPEDLPFGFVYGAFINAIMYDRVELKGHNIHAFITAFKNWITQSGVEDNLRRSYHQSNPEASPKQIKGRNKEEESEETKKLRAEGYVNFTPDVVNEQIEKIEMMWGTMGEALEAFPGAKSYVRRLYNTREKMKKEGNL